MEAHLRGATPEDGRFIADSWLRSYKHAYHVKRVPAEVYWREHRALIQRLVGRSDTVVLCDPQDIWTIWGWACYEQEPSALTVHYVYVKDGFRGFDLASLLVEHLYEAAGKPPVVQWTHSTKCADAFVEHLRREGLLSERTAAFYNPYQMYRGNP